MKGSIAGLCLGFMNVAFASYFSFQSQRTIIGGKNCGVGVSYGWTR